MASLPSTPQGVKEWMEEKEKEKKDSGYSELEFFKQAQADLFIQKGFSYSEAVKMVNLGYTKPIEPRNSGAPTNEELKYIFDVQQVRAGGQPQPRTNQPSQELYQPKESTVGSDLQRAVQEAFINAGFPAEGIGGVPTAKPAPTLLGEAIPGLPSFTDPRVQEARNAELARGRAGRGYAGTILTMGEQNTPLTEGNNFLYGVGRVPLTQRDMGPHRPVDLTPPNANRSPLSKLPNISNLAILNGSMGPLGNANLAKYSTILAGQMSSGLMNRPAIGSTLFPIPKLPKFPR